jgi:hypothetical protein
MGKRAAAAKSESAADMSRDQTMTSDRTGSEPQFERGDASPRGVAYAILGLFAGIGVSAALVAGLLYWSEPPAQKPARTPLQAAAPAPKAPRLEVSPTGDGPRIEAQAQHMLKGYAWIDRSAGIARIPIERAMDLTAKQGWPDDRRKPAP